MEKEHDQKLEWIEAQRIAITEDLVASAKRHLSFLAAVDRTRWLYEPPSLHYAIYRYNAYWLPLLAKHHEMPQTEALLVVPLDCEWIWHCHRLNPIRYKMDCLKLYGKILDNSKVVSSTEGTSKTETETVWKRLFPEEPYELDSNTTNVPVRDSKPDNFTDYDLVAAVQRQSPFYYQVSRPFVNTDLFLQGALERYKGFLHLIRRNREMSIRRFCVPTYDIDLIWHTHQLHPLSYCNDMVQLLGKILEHDDMDADRSKGTKLDVGFSGTTKQWEESFGTRYWRAGAMYRGSAPAPVTKTPYSFQTSGKKMISVGDSRKILQLPKLKYVEALVEIVDVRNLPEGIQGSPYVVCSKKQPDAFFSAKRNLRISSKAGEKYVASFQCEPKGEIHFELMLQKHSHLPLPKQFRPLGSTSFSVSEFLTNSSAVAVEKWFELVPNSANDSLKPVGLRIALSSTLPVSAPSVLQIVHPHSFLQKSCFFAKPGKVKHSKSWTPIADEAGEEILSLQMRDSPNRKIGDNTVLREVLCLKESGEVQCLARQVEGSWLSAGCHWSLKKSSDSVFLFDLVGTRAVRLYFGRKLEFEPRHCGKSRSELDFITAVEFSSENPYGIAVALLELKSGIITVKDDWFLIPGLTVGFIVIEMLKKEGFNGISVGGGNVIETFDDVPIFPKAIDGPCLENKNGDQPKTCDDSGEINLNLNLNLAAGETVMPEKETVNSGGCGTGCGSGCGGGCGSMISSGGCGGGCGAGCGGCGSMVSSGGCGGGCGSGCGGCGGGLGGNKDANDGYATFCGGSGGCGGCGGRSFVSTEKSAGRCGGGCGGCGGVCGVNSTQQTRTSTPCNQEFSQQVAVNAN